MDYHNNENISTFNPELDSQMEEIIIPVRIHIIKDDYGIYTSARSDHNIAVVLREANRIWKQAEIYFKIEDIVMTEVFPDTILKTIYDNSSELNNHDNFDSGKVNAFFAQSLNGINGFSSQKINSILVADFTTVNDFRTTAHELGHILGLIHVEPTDRLMSSGTNGETLSPTEVLSARDKASIF